MGGMERRPPLEPWHKPEHSPDTPRGAAPSGPGAESGRNDPQRRPWMPGRPSSDASGRLNGSRLVIGDDLISASRPLSITAAAAADEEGEEEDAVEGRAPAADREDAPPGEVEEGEAMEPDRPPLAPAPRGEDGVAEDEESIATAPFPPLAAIPELVAEAAVPPSASPCTFNVTAARDQSVW